MYDATRPASISTSDGTTIAFGYDEANNRIYEDQTISGLPTRRVQTDPDADGNRIDLLVKTGNTINTANYFDYTSRNRSEERRVGKGGGYGWTTDNDEE